MRHSIIIPVALLCAAALTAPPPAFADDGAIYDVGGTIALMDEHATVELVAEHVHARVHRHYALVECVFFLRNNGPETTVTVGFPDMPGEDRGPFEYFESFVDGRRVDVECVEVKDRPHDPIRYWWVKKVTFLEGEMVVVRNVYRGGIGSNVAMTKWFEYVLHTGHSWAGPIGSVSIVFTLEDFGTEYITKVEPERCQVDAHEIRWTRHNYEPDSNRDVVMIYWDTIPETDIESELHRKAALGDTAGVGAMLDAGADINGMRRYGITPLIDAIYFGAGPGVVAYLIRHGADVNFKKEGWGPPLITALIAHRRYDYPFTKDVVELLIDSGAVVTANYRYFIEGMDDDLIELLKKHSEEQGSE